MQQKLKLSSVDSIYLASVWCTRAPCTQCVLTHPPQTGERVTSLDALQDIDELHVVEVRTLLVSWLATKMYNAHTNNLWCTGSCPRQWHGTQRQRSTHIITRGVVSTNIVLPAGTSACINNVVIRCAIVSPQEPKHPVAAADTASSNLDIDGDGDAKYIKRNNMLRRTLQSMFPAAFAPTLPVTTKDVDKEASTPHDVARAARRRSSRGRPRGGWTGRLVLLVALVVAAMLMMLYVFRRTALPDLRS